MTDNENRKTPEISEVKNEKRAPARRRPAVKKAAEAKDSKIEKPKRTQARPAKAAQSAPEAGQETGARSAAPLSLIHI